MKNIILLLITASFLLYLSGCKESTKARTDSSGKEHFISDNSELEEAKAISRKIFDGIEKVEKSELSRAEFQAYAKPLQQKLNALVVHMNEEEVQELETYNDKLMDALGTRIAQEKKSPE